MANDPAPQLAAKPLFGGAIAMSLPVNYGDASDLRQIPDNQEVFLSPSSDTSLVVEVLAMVEDGQASTDLWEAVKFHFESIAHDNASLSSDILTPPPNDHIVSQVTRLDSTSSLINLDTPAPQILTGLQRIHKFSHNPTGAPRAGHEDDTPDEVFIGVALWRVWIENASTSTSKRADLVCSVNVNLSSEDGTGPAERNTVEEWWLRSVGSLRIRDWDLFGDTE